MQPKPQTRPRSSRHVRGYWRIGCLLRKEPPALVLLAW
ncbi:hypothetical protein PITC_092730 [Penicillium italicum]|uniref:Uncharacterized protein n=1 Tax=Penicillium italicum TaxID=40296 RepID=A0A0A2LDL6_PENIT|nr:hypothetical protein PITC_092730 [Penicillium italicum]